MGFEKEGFRRFPVDAAVRDRKSVGELCAFSRGEFLAAVDEVAFQHGAGDRDGGIFELFDNLPEYIRLARRVFPAVGMAAIDHDMVGCPGLFQGLGSCAYGFFVKVRAIIPAT